MPSSFPTSDHELGGFREVEFRDGPRHVPDYVADMMTNIDTLRYSYEEAMVKANQSLAQRHIGRVYDKVIQQHFRGGLR